MTRRRKPVSSIVALDSGVALGVALPYEDARERIRLATEEGYLHVELPIDWSREGSGEARDSLVALRAIASLRSTPEGMPA